MKDFWQKILVMLVGAAIIGNTVLMLNIRDRLTRIETTLSMQHSTAQLSHE